LLTPDVILKLKCTNFDFAGGAYSATPGPLAGFKGPTCKRREGERTGGKGKAGRREGTGTYF